MALLYLLPPALALLYLLIQARLLYAWARLPEVVVPPDYEPCLPITVLVPARNEAAGIEAALAAIFTQTYPQHLLEIIVIDDHSTDGTAARVLALAGQDERLRLLSLADHLGGRPVVAYKKAALEWGAAEARGALVVTTDADCMPSPSWLRTLAWLYETEAARFLTGPVVIQPTADFLSTFQALDLAGYMVLTGGAVALQHPLLANGANLGFSKALFRRVGGYDGLRDRASGDDVLLLQKVVRERAARVFFVKSRDAVVTTRPVTTWSGLWQQRLRWAAKTGAYQEPRLVVLQGLVFALCWSILLSLAAAPWQPALLMAGLSAWVLKGIADYVLLRRAACYFGHPRWLRYYLPAQLLHTAYIAVLGTVALFGPRTTWKGRKSR